MADTPRPQDKLAILRRLGLFASCTEEQLQLVAQRTRLVEYKKGEVVYQEGNKADAFYVVVSGRLRIFTVTDGHEQVYTIVHNGDTFGEISLLTGEMHSASIDALNDTLVLRLAKEDFDELINRIPSLVLYLSRLLSKRLRAKGQTAAAGEATVVAVYSAAGGVGRTVFAAALAASLRRETSRPVIVADFSTPAGTSNPLFGASTPAPAIPAMMAKGLWSGEGLEEALREHALGFHVFDARALIEGENGAQTIAPLVSALANRYSYIVMDLPTAVDATAIKALTQADLIYLLTDRSKDCLIRTNALMRQLRESVGHLDERMKVTLNLMECTGECLTPAEIAQSLGHAINHTLPHMPEFAEGVSAQALGQMLEGRQSVYAKTVRRIARELGGVLVGLALGSGAAMGLAHVGVLKVLEREGIPIDIIAGSSIGAMIGGLWASGRTSEQLEQLAMRFRNPWDVRKLFMLDFGLPTSGVLIGVAAGLFMWWLTGFWAGFLLFLMVSIVLGLLMGPLIGGPIQGAQLTAKLEADFGGKTFDDTWLPLKVVASNPMAREEVVIESGSLAEAVRASVSIPGIFKPVMRLGKICLDGGVVNPVPVSVLRRYGAKRIIAVNVFPTTSEVTAHLEQVKQRRAEWDAQLASRGFLVRLLSHVRQEIVRSMYPLVFDVIMRSMQAMEYKIAEVSCHDADLILRPTVPGAHWLEFNHPDRFIQRGEEEALRHLPAIKRLVGMEPASLTTSGQTGTMESSHGS